MQSSEFVGSVISDYSTGIFDNLFAFSPNSSVFCFCTSNLDIVLIRFVKSGKFQIEQTKVTKEFDTSPFFARQFDSRIFFCEK